MKKPPKYRDYLNGDSLNGSAEDETAAMQQSSDESSDLVVVMRFSGEHWHAVWQGMDAALGEFDGTKDEAIAWARQRAARCLVYSEETGDVEPLSGEGEK